MGHGSPGCERRAGLSGISRVLLALPALLLISPAPGEAGIDRVEAALRCGETPRLDAGTTLDVTLHGDGTEAAESIRCTSPGCGITGTVTRRGAGAGGGPFAALRLQAPAHEPPGEKTVEVRTTGPGSQVVESGTFLVLVPAPLITRIAAPRQSDGFTLAVLEVEGHDLPRTLSLSDGSLAVIALTGASGGSRLQGGASGGRVEGARWQRSTSRRGRLTVRFAEAMRFALLEVRMRPPGSCYTPGSNVAQAEVGAGARDARGVTPDLRPAARSARIRGEGH